MALLPILHYPDPRLSRKSLEIKIIDDEIKQLAQDMLETMYAAPGVGLAAPQVNKLVRLIVMDTSEEKNQPQVLINPVITKKSEPQLGEEGCLSVPGIYAEVKRAKTIEVKALNQNGEQLEFKADDLISVCIQHEIDHLEGKLFVDYLSKLKQQRIIKKMKKRNF